MRNEIFWHKNKCFLKAKYLFCNYNIQFKFGTFFFYWLLESVIFKNPTHFYFSQEVIPVSLDCFT